MCSISVSPCRGIFPSQKNLGDHHWHNLMLGESKNVCPGNFAPGPRLDGFAEGQLAAISEYETLFNFIGHLPTAGTGQSTFACPTCAAEFLYIWQTDSLTR